jgi:hypothetical protein
MSHLDDLPNELLLQIALALQPSISDCNNDVYNLALVARTFRSIAQEALYTRVSVRSSQIQTKPNRVGCLARTLIERPGLARRIQELDLALMWKVYSHEDACNAPNEKCTCHWDEIKNLCLGFLNMTDLGNSAWDEAITAGFEEAVAGVVICLLPGLHTLSLDNCHTTKYLDMNGARVLVPRRIDTNHMFGIAPEGLNPNLIPGFANLKHIKSNGQLPWQLINLPYLETLQIGTLPTILNYPFDYSLSSGVTFNLTSLTIPMNIVALEYDYVHDIDGGTEYRIFNKRIFQCLSCLKRLDIQFYRNCGSRGSRLGDHKTTPPGIGDYNNALKAISSSSLETLVLDTSDVDVRAVEKWKLATSFKGYLDDCIRPLTSLLQFPNLKTIIAPQQAFLSSNGNSDVEPILSLFLFNLPPSVVSVGVIDPTVHILKWFDHISEQKQTYCPNLTKIELWTDHDPSLVAFQDQGNILESSMIQLRRFVGVATTIHEQLRGWRNTKVHQGGG